MSIRRLGKRFGGVVALADVDLDVERGQTVAICGGNGAGKSSLVRILAGAEAPSSGWIECYGQSIPLSSPRDALRAGLATIHQDLALAPGLSAWENIFMGCELTRWGVLAKARMRRKSRDLLGRLLPEPPDPRRRVAELSGGQRQAVAISRALLWHAQIIVMDEPTAALGVVETDHVLGLVRRLAAEGRTVMLVSHDMHGVAAVADRIVVLREGRKVEDRPTAGLDAVGLARLVAG